jgi:hypothetical protein
LPPEAEPKAWSPRDFDAALDRLLESKGSSPDKIVEPMRRLFDKLGKAVFLHILELWDYVGIDA